MAKNHKTLYRHIRMLRMIPREPESITAYEVCQKLVDQGLEVSKRTVQRDLEQYCAEFPLSCTQDEKTNTKHWFFLKDAYLFDLPKMSPVEALTFSLVERFLGNTLPKTARETLNPHFKSINAYLKNLNPNSWSRWGEKIRFIPRTQPLKMAEVDGQAMDGIFDALWKEKQVSVTYKSRHKDVVEYIIHPLGLVFRNEVTYLVGTLWNYKDIKQLALHRFKSVEILDDDRNVPSGFDLDNYIDQDAFQYPECKSKHPVTIRFYDGAADHLYETPLSEDQELTHQDDGSILLEATLKITQQFQWWVLGFGEGAEVIEPKFLREKFKSIAKQMVAQYQEK